MTEPTDIMTTILIDIRDELRGVRAELREVREELHDVRTEVVGTNARIDKANVRGEAFRDLVGDMMRDDRRRLEALEHRVTRLEGGE